MSPGELLRRFVLDFLVEEALKQDPTIGQDSRRALAASFSVEPLVDLGNIRKYRVISTQMPSNRRVYLFMFQRASGDRAFSSTELCFRRCLTVLRDQDPGVHQRDRDVLIRESLRRHRSVDKMGLLLTEALIPKPDVSFMDPGSLSDIPKSLLELGVMEVYPEGTLNRLQLPRASRRRLTPSSLRRPSSAEAKQRPEPAHTPPELQTVSVHDWIRRAFIDTFGRPPIHISVSAPNGPVFTIRVLELTESHEKWAAEVTRHLRVREGSMSLEVRMLEVR